jgi:hypothetical protein
LVRIFSIITNKVSQFLILSIWKNG